MDKRFINLFALTEDEAIALLDTPPDQLGETDSRYVAASHLAGFPTARSIQALIRAVHTLEDSLDNRIVRRKAVESLGKLKAQDALAVVRPCLAEEDNYLVENTVWTIGEIGTQDPAILEEIAQLLDKPGQTYRVIIHTLANLGYQPAVERIRRFVEAEDTTIASAAIAAICRLTGDYSTIDQVIDFIVHPNVYTRRLSIQDLVDAKHYPAIPEIVQAPVSIVFRLRGIRMLAEAGVAADKLTFTDIQTPLETVLLDHPKTLQLVHAYDQTPSLDFLINELYQTDFGRCYLAIKTILEVYPDTAGPALLAAYAGEAQNDYGAHYHVVKLLGWLKYEAGYPILLDALHRPEPQFQKSRAAAAIALAEFGDPDIIPDLQASLKTKIWDLKYAALMALEHFGDYSNHEQLLQDADWCVRAKASAKTRGLHNPALHNPASNLIAAL